MSDNVELYDGAYGNYDSDVYRQVRIETYGRDFGQTSWVTTEESEEIPRSLALTSDSFVLEIGCGSGAYALHIAHRNLAVTSSAWISMIWEFVLRAS